MTAPLILASGSEIRAQLLSKANVGYETVKPRVDEEMIKRSLQAEGCHAAGCGGRFGGVKSAKGKLEAARSDGFGL